MVSSSAVTISCEPCAAAATQVYRKCALDVVSALILLFLALFPPLRGGVANQILLVSEHSTSAWFFMPNVRSADARVRRRGRWYPPSAPTSVPPCCGLPPRSFRPPLRASPPLSGNVRPRWADIVDEDAAVDLGSEPLGLPLCRVSGPVPSLEYAADFSVDHDSVGFVPDCWEDSAALEQGAEVKMEPEKLVKVPVATDEPEGLGSPPAEASVVSAMVSALAGLQQLALDQLGPIANLNDGVNKLQSELVDVHSSTSARITNLAERFSMLESQCKPMWNFSGLAETLVSDMKALLAKVTDLEAQLTKPEKPEQAQGLEDAVAEKQDLARRLGLAQEELQWLREQREADAEAFAVARPSFEASCSSKCFGAPVPGTGLAPGVRVVLFGLTSEQGSKLNGYTGSLGSLVDGRWQVRLRFGKSAAIKPSNLRNDEVRWTGAAGERQAWIEYCSKVAENNLLTSSEQVQAFLDPSSGLEPDLRHSETSLPSSAAEHCGAGPAEPRMSC